VVTDAGGGGGGGGGGSADADLWAGGVIDGAISPHAHVSEVSSDDESVASVRSHKQGPGLSSAVAAPPLRPERGAGPPPPAAQRAPGRLAPLASAPTPASVLSPMGVGVGLSTGPGGALPPRGLGRPGGGAPVPALWHSAIVQGGVGQGAASAGPTVVLSKADRSFWGFAAPRPPAVPSDVSFRDIWLAAFKWYVVGEWEAAARVMLVCKTMRPRDGPCRVLLGVMQEHGVRGLLAQGGVGMSSPSTGSAVGGATGSGGTLGGAAPGHARSHTSMAVMGGGGAASGVGGASGAALHGMSMGPRTFGGGAPGGMGASRRGSAFWGESPPPPHVVAAVAALPPSVAQALTTHPAWGVVPGKYTWVAGLQAPLDWKGFRNLLEK
jgi:hypothetical protein